jgi:hypothetical protein
MPAMPNIKPLRKLVTKARTIRDDHRARHAPSGFAFALADSIDYLDQSLGQSNLSQLNISFAALSTRA